MKLKDTNFFMRLKNDEIYRTFILAIGSLGITILFTIYNACLCWIYKAQWNGEIAVYYFLLACVRGYTIFSEYRMYKYINSDIKTKNRKRKRNYFIQSVLIIILDLALIVPISILIANKGDVNYTTMHTFVSGAYTLFKITIATISYFRLKNNHNLNVRTIISVGLIDALVSILSLLYVLIMTFSTVKDNMSTAVYVVCVIIWVIIMIISLINLVKSISIKIHEMKDLDYEYSKIEKIENKEPVTEEVVNEEQKTEESVKEQSTNEEVKTENLIDEQSTSEEVKTEESVKEQSTSEEPTK